MSVSALVINWNEVRISGRTVERLLNDPDVDEVVVVDNGSSDGSKEYFRSCISNRLRLVDLPDNLGISIGRNAGLFVTTGSYVFMIDGDILYVPGTISEYRKVLELGAFANVGCIGCYHVDRRLEGKRRDTADESEADQRMPLDYVVEDWFPIAWTQYGLFRGDMLRSIRFVDTPPFNQPGYGYEDDWLFMDMQERGWRSLHANRPLYFHDRQATFRNMDKGEANQTVFTRLAEFEKRWGPWQGHEENLVRRIRTGGLHRSLLLRPARHDSTV